MSNAFTSARRLEMAKLSIICLLPQALGGFLSAAPKCAYEQIKLCGAESHTCINGTEDCSNLCGPTPKLENCTSACRVTSRPVLVDVTPKRSHFRASPLSFYTPDARNQRFFGPNLYGMRLSWMWSSPPSELWIGGVTVPWRRRGVIALRKSGWPSALKYASVDLALPNGTSQNISVGGFTYMLQIPSAGTSQSADDIMFIGDINANEDGIWSKIGTRQVVRDVLRT